MTNKEKNEIKQSNFLKMKLKNIVITYIIFLIIVFILALFKKYSVISSDVSLIPFYLISAIIAFGIMIMLACKMNKVYRKKEPGVSLCVNFIGIFLLVSFGMAIDIRKELIDFSKNSTKTDAIIIEISKNEKFVKDKCDNGIRHGPRCKSITSDQEWYAKDYYEVYFTYQLQYRVGEKIYTSKYNDDKQKFDYKEQAANCKSKYDTGDYITVYYDNDNPKNIKRDFALGFGMVYFFEVIAILFQFYYFIKHKKLMKEVVK